MTRYTSLPKHLARELMLEIEAGGIPAVMLRGDGQINPDGVRDYDVLVPAEILDEVGRRHDARRDELLAAADAWRRELVASSEAPRV